MTLTETTTPPPGSDDAIERGCTCPVVDNGHGRGAMLPAPETARHPRQAEPLYWVSETCPLHGLRAQGWRQ